VIEERGKGVALIAQPARQAQGRQPGGDRRRRPRVRGGETIHDRAKLVDWQDKRNEWLAVSQFTIVGANKRRTDILIFLNGLPLVVMELKVPEAKNADIVSAYNQIQTYKVDIPALFRTNLMSVLSDGFAARFGTLSADFDRHMAWRTVDGEELVDPKSAIAWETLVRGLLRRDIAAAILGIAPLDTDADYVDHVKVDRLIAGADWRDLRATRAERIAASERAWATWGPARRAAKAQGTGDQFLPGESLTSLEDRLGLRAGRDFSRAAS
jgi:hypothetical protein